MQHNVYFPVGYGDKIIFSTKAWDIKNDSFEIFE
jgi:hypothetical protein